MDPAEADLANLPRFLDHLQARDAVAADLARRLLGAGARVRSFWGPQQMDVRELLVQRGDILVRFGVERGFSDGVGIAGAGTDLGLSDFRSMRPAMLAWARANAVPFRVEDIDARDLDLATHGLAALDWLGNGHLEDAERVWSAWRDHHARLDGVRYRTYGRPSDERVRAVTAEGLAAIEAAARPPG